MELLTVQGLTKNFGRKRVLDGLDMTITKGKIVGLLGPNGSGKTTLMKIIAGLTAPTQGQITYPNNAKRGVESKGTIAFLPDNMQFPAWMKVADAFEFYKRHYPDYNSHMAKTMQEILNISPTDTISKLSKGMQERVALGVTFSRNVPLYLLDEPLGGIDPVGRSKVLQSIIATHHQDSSILLSTHLIKDVEAVFDNVLFIKDGKIAAYHDCEDLRQDSNKKVEDVYMEVFGDA